jgi:HEPN domain-containing protein
MRPEADEIARWLRKAQHDLTAARRLLTPDCVEFDVVAFHCQQAVEKSLKAFLVAHRVEFEKIHDIRRLLDLCAAIDADFNELRASAEPLTIFAVTFRYPGPAEPTRADAERALAAAEGACVFAGDRTRAHGGDAPDERT